MREVPFYQNHPDMMHCAVAVNRMILDYFLGKKMTWAEADEFTGYKNHRAAWTVYALVNFIKLGFDIKMIEPFDYKKYYEEGESYLSEVHSPVELKWQYDHSNILEMRQQIPNFLANVQYENRRPTLDDLDKMLDDGRLVFLTLDSKTLDGNKGYEAHVVLVFRKTANFYIIHDPRTAAGHWPNRRVSRKRLYEAMGGENSTSEMTGFKV